jgi:hypothetical protein
MANLPAHLFIADDGNLYDTRNPEWSRLPPLRWGYRHHRTNLENAQHVKAALRAGAHSDLGGYPLFFWTDGGSALSFDAVRQEFRQVLESFKTSAAYDWSVRLLTVNWESDLTCEHTGKRIPAAYRDDEESDDDI